MKKFIRISSCILVILMIVSLASCGNNTAETEQSQTAAVTEAPAATEEITVAETEDLSYTCELPDLDYEGTTVRILAANRDASKDEFNCTETNGAAINDAVYKRNCDVEKLLNVTLKIKLCASATDYGTLNLVKTQVASGDELYDIVTTPGYTPVSYIVEGDFHNLHNVQNLNLEKSYWVQGFNEIMDNGTRQYVCLGAYSISSIRMMNVIVYNKDLIEDRNLEDPYTMAMNGNWTVENQLKLIADSYSDTNGNSTPDEEDFYGFVAGGCVSVDSYLTAFGSNLLALDSDGEYILKIDSDRFVTAVEKVQELIFNNPNSYSVGTSGSTDSAFTPNKMNMFAAERCLMASSTIYQIEAVLTPSGFSGDYGIVPQPKLDENQEDYYTYVQDQMTVMGVVSTVSADRLPMIGAVMEAISSESYNTVFPAYYEVSLSYRFLKNAESKNMLDKIYSTVTLEGTILYSPIFGMISTLRSIMRGDDGSAATTLAGQIPVWTERLNTLNSSLAAID